MPCRREPTSLLSSFITWLWTASVNTELCGYWCFSTCQLKRKKSAKFLPISGSSYSVMASQCFNSQSIWDTVKAGRTLMHTYVEWKQFSHHVVTWEYFALPTSNLIWWRFSVAQRKNKNPHPSNTLSCFEPTALFRIHFKIVSLQ